MHKDANLRKRDSLVIPGGLLAAYGLIGLAYVALLRDDSNTCDDRTLVVFLGACRSAYFLLAIPFILGVALVLVGALGARSTATCRDGHGSWAHFTLAFLVSLVVLPLLAFLAAPSLLGADAALTRGTVEYPIRTILAGLTAIGLLMLVPFAALYSAQRRANPCCREKGCFDPCFCDEAVAPEEPLAPPAEPAPADETPALESLPTSPPPAVAPVPPVIEPMAAPDAEAGSWEAVPGEKPAESWEVLPDEPAGDDGGTEPPKAASGGRRAPGLAARPTDPAAPPADAMAVAAKWAEEDEEALEGMDATPGKGSGRRKAAKPSKKKSGLKTGAKASKPPKKAKK